jgi:hypothetical protein
VVDVLASLAFDKADDFDELLVKVGEVLDSAGGGDRGGGRGIVEDERERLVTWRSWRGW